MYVSACLLATLVLPPCSHEQWVVDILDMLFFSHWRRHIAMKVVHSAAFDPNQQYVLGAFPHGVRKLLRYCCQEHAIP
jgi:hypothetical protein